LSEHDPTPAALLAWYYALKKRKHTGTTSFVWHLGGIRQGGVPVVAIKATEDWAKAKEM
jgi:hypothetical protein